MLEQGNLTAGRNEFMNVCWPFTCVGKLKMDTGHSPAFQVEDGGSCKSLPVSAGRKKGKEERIERQRNKEGQKESSL